MIGMGRSDTIYALSSGATPSGVAVIRISGSLGPAVLERIGAGGLVPRQAVLRVIRGHGNAVIDQAVCIHFPEPHSFTGEHVVELHVHGGRAVVAAVMRELAAVEGARPAEAGEFAWRAFQNGKLDLAQSEALSDLIEAETESQRRLAVAGTMPGAYYRYDSWRAQLVELRAIAESQLDFSDQDDVGDQGGHETAAQLIRLRDDMQRATNGTDAQEIVRHGYRVVLVGAPNVGKSSLLNALARRDVAIVTEIAGTTRDLIEVPLDIGDHKVVVTDTAGLRETSDVVEAIGIERATAAASHAHLVLRLSTEGTPAPIVNLQDVEIIDIWTKADLFPSPSPALSVSTLTGDGIERLVEEIAKRVTQAGAPDGMPLQVRHRALLTSAANSLDAALGANDQVLCAEHLRLAADSLGRLTGRIDVEDLLGAIFSRFCIGK